MRLQKIAEHPTDMYTFFKILLGFERWYSATCSCNRISSGNAKYRL